MQLLMIIVILSRSVEPMLPVLCLTPTNANCRENMVNINFSSEGPIRFAVPRASRQVKMDLAFDQEMQDL